MSVLSQALLASYGGVPQAPDPLFPFVRALLHMDGPNGSQTFLDSSASPKSITAFGDAQINTSQFQFGGASGLFDGGADYLTVGSATDANLASNDFCIECFIRRDNVSTLQRIISTRTVSNGGFDFIIGATGVIGFDVRNSGTLTASALSTSTVPPLTWTHLAVDRSGSTMRLFINGNLESSVAAGASSQDGQINIGRRPLAGGPTHYFGYIDEFRFTVGASRYTANFTPPAAPFPDF